MRLSCHSGKNILDKEDSGQRRWQRPNFHKPCFHFYRGGAYQSLGDLQWSSSYFTMKPGKSAKLSWNPNLRPLSSILVNVLVLVLVRGWSGWTRGCLQILMCQWGSQHVSHQGYGALNNVHSPVNFILMSITGDRLAEWVGWGWGSDVTKQNVQFACCHMMEKRSTTNVGGNSVRLPILERETKLRWPSVQKAFWVADSSEGEAKPVLENEGFGFLTFLNKRFEMSVSIFSFAIFAKRNQVEYWTRPHLFKLASNLCRNVIKH